MKRWVDRLVSKEVPGLRTWIAMGFAVLALALAFEAEANVPTCESIFAAARKPGPLGRLADENRTEAKSLLKKTVGHDLLFSSYHQQALIIALKIHLDYEMLNTAEVSSGNEYRVSAARQAHDFYRNSGEESLKLNLARTTVTTLMDMFQAEYALHDFSTRQNLAESQIKKLKISKKRFFEIQTFLHEVNSDPAKLEFLIQLFNEGNPTAADQIYAHVPGVAPYIAHTAIVAAPSLISTAITGDPGAGLPFSTVGGIVYGLGYQLTRAVSDRNMNIARVLAKPGNLLRRAVATYRLKKMVKEAGVESPEEPIEILPEAKQEKVIDEAIHKVASTFNRARIEALNPEIDLSSLQSAMVFGHELLNSIPNLTDRQVAIVERRTKFASDLTKLIGELEAPKQKKDLPARARAALDNRFAQLNEMVVDLSELRQDITLVLEQLDRHIRGLETRRNEIEVSSPEMQAEVESIQAEIAGSKVVVESLMQAALSLETQLQQERSDLRQLRVAVNAIAIQEISQHIDASSPALQNLRKLYARLADSNLE